MLKFILQNEFSQLQHTLQDLHSRNYLKASYVSAEQRTAFISQFCLFSGLTCFGMVLTVLYTQSDTNLTRLALDSENMALTSTLDQVRPRGLEKLRF